MKAPTESRFAHDSVGGDLDRRVPANLGATPYLEAWELQRSLATAVQEGTIPDTVVLLEHPPVITAGRRTDDNEVHVPEDSDVEIVETTGGESRRTTPGQLVCYPILDLNRHGRDVRKYCRTSKRR